MLTDNKLHGLQRVLMNDPVPMHIPLPHAIPIVTVNALFNHNLSPTKWVIGQQEVTHPTHTCYMCRRRGHLSWTYILHQCTICHQYAPRHDQMRCPVHLAWEADKFPASEHANAYCMYEIPLSEVTGHIWRITSNYDELGQPDIPVMYWEQDAGYHTAMEYVCIYRLEPEAYQRSIKEELPGDLPILEGE